MDANASSSTDLETIPSEPTEPGPSPKAHPAIGALGRGVPGARRLGRGLGLAAALILSALADARWSEPLIQRLTGVMWNAKMAAQVLHWARSSDEKIGMSQFAAFIVTIGLVVAITGAYGTVRALLERTRVSSIAGAVLDVSMALLAWRLAARMSPFAGGLALATLGVSSLSVAVYCGSGHPIVREAGPVARAAIVLGSEAAAFSWALWWFASPGLGLFALLAILAIFVVVGMRIGGTAHDPARSARDAIAGSPALLLPFVGLLRAPSAFWCVAALVAIFLVRGVFEIPRWGARVTRIPGLLVECFAPLALTAIFFLPLRFREINGISHEHHEAQHLGWISSVTFGHFLFADSGFIYGPLREYALLVIAWLSGGLTLEHVRLAHLVLTIVGTGVILVVGWRVARGRPWVFALWCYLLLVRTPLFFFLDYIPNLNFGWVDGARGSFALLALVGALAAADRFDGSRRATKVLFAWGLLAGFSVLYSHDTGVVAVIALVVALPVDALLRRRDLPIRARLERLVRTGGALAVGTVAPLALFAIVYIAAGRGSGLAGAITFVKELSAGVATAGAYPLRTHDFLSADAFFANLPPKRFDYALPPAILALAAVTLVATVAYARWSARSTLFLALFAFSCSLYRYALMRSDTWHLCAGSLGAYVLLVALVADVSSFRIALPFRHRRGLVPLGAIVMGILAALAVFAGEQDGGLSPRLKRIASGEEHPSMGPAFTYPAYPEIRRIGDENAETPVLDLVKYVREHTKPSEPIWLVTDFLDGGEIYFLAQRRNATMFDIWSEVITEREARLVMNDLRRDPPILIIGHGWKDYEQTITDYVNAHWKLVDTISGKEIRRYDPATGH